MSGIIFGFGFLSLPILDHLAHMLPPLAHVVGTNSVRAGRVRAAWVRAVNLSQILAFWTIISIQKA